MRKKLVGVAAVGILAIGIMLGGLFKGFGLGPGNGTGNTGDQSGSVARTPVDRDVNVNTQIGRDNPVRPVEPPPPEQGPLLILVTGAGYRMLASEAAASQGTPITLAEIQARSSARPASPDGIRVRVLKSRSAQEGARADLMSALNTAGIKRDEIQERAEFLE